MKIGAYACLFLMYLLLSGCSANRPPADVPVPFTIARHYFVNNTVGALGDTVITDQARFNDLFGMAATMGPEGKPTPIDFSRQFVIAIALPETSTSTDLHATALTIEDGRLVLDYTVAEGQPQSFTIRPLLMVIVDRDHLAPVTCRRL